MNIGERRYSNVCYDAPGNREVLRVEELLFVGGPADGQRAFVEPVRYVRWPVLVELSGRAADCLADAGPLMEKDESVEYKRISVGGFEVMFFDEGIHPLKKLIDGYKAP